MLTIQEILKERISDYDSLSLPQVVEKGREIIFNFDYPTASDESKKLIETEFIIRFFTRALSRESFDYWQLKLYGVMNDIMPYYNERIKSQEWFKEIENPLFNVNITDSYTGDGSTTAKGNESSTYNADSSSDYSANTNSSSKTNSSGNTDSDSTSKNSSDSTGGSKATSKNDSYSVNSDYPQSPYDELTDYASTSGINRVTSESDSSSESKSSSKTNSSSSTNSTSTGESNDSTDSTSTSKGTNNSNRTATSTGTKEQNSSYTLERKGINGSRTIGEIIQANRKSFINTTEEILTDDLILQLFIGCESIDVDNELPPLIYPYSWLVWL